MIAFLKGVVKRIESHCIMVDVRGVGYEVFVSNKTCNGLSLHSTVELEIYTHVREDSFKLYGFFTHLEKELFCAFIGISGVGPKMALSVLSAVSSLDLLVEMIEKEDVKGLCSLPRVGKKIAQQMVLGLKGNLPIGVGKSEEIQMKKWLNEVLSHLGFHSKEIHKVLDQIPFEKDQSKALKKALSYLRPDREVVADGA